MFDFPKAIEQIEQGEREVAYVLEDAYDAGIQDASGGDPGVYRVLYRLEDKDEWYPLFNKSHTEFYSSLGGAKQAITHDRKRVQRWQVYGDRIYKIQASPLRWEDVK